MKQDGKTSPLANWLPAKHYTYTITIGAEQIFVSPSVASWENVPVSSVI